MSNLPDHLQDLNQRIHALPSDQFMLTLSQIDGFVTGIALAPSSPHPERWLESLFVPPDEDESIAIGPDQKKAISDLILHHLDEVADELGEGTFAPLLDENDRGEVVWQLWALGFAAALQHDVDAWEAVEDEDVQECLHLLLGLAVRASEEVAGREDLDLENGAEIADLIPELVQEINDILYADLDADGTELDDAPPYGPSEMPVRLGPKVGRNDPCPCGSGKKYKKCCGA